VIIQSILLSGIFAKAFRQSSLYNLFISIASFF
jgi:hypothetical protein